jgi:uncharacterized protein (TIGR02284 family)
LQFFNREDVMNFTEETRHSIKHLSSLIQLDVDAIQAYNQAIENTDVPEVRERLVEFRDDHERHVLNLSDEVRALGGEPPERKRDVKGFFIESFTAIRSRSTEGALKAMRMNEELINRTYEKALAAELTDNARRLVREAYEDEQSHLEYVTYALAEKRWEVRKAG